MFSSFSICRLIVERLGKDRMSNIIIVGKLEMEQSLYGQLVFGNGVTSSLDEQLVKEARKAGRFIILWLLRVHMFKHIHIFIPKL